MSNVNVMKSTSRKKEDIKYVTSICKVSGDEALQLLEKFDWNFKKTIDEYKHCKDEFLRIEALEKEQEQSSDSETTEGSETNDEDEFLDNIQQAAYPSQTKVISKRMKKDILKKLLSDEIDVVEPSTACDDPDKTYLKILSWNLCSRNGDHQIARINHIIEFIDAENVDIVFVQDVVPITFGYLKTRLVDTADGGYIGCRDEMRGDEAIFLKKTTVDHKENWYARDSLMAEVTISGCKFFLLNSHLKSSLKQRKEQLQRCFDKIADKPPIYNSIFGGDLSIVKENEVTIPEGVCDLWNKCGGKKKDRSNKYTMDSVTNTNLEKESKNCRSRPDRFYFVQSNVKNVIPRSFRVIDHKYGQVEGTGLFPSDHFGIFATFEVPKSVEVSKSNNKTRKRKSNVLDESLSHNVNNSDE